MAAVTGTTVTKRLPVGDRVMQTFRTTALGTAAADEYIVTGLSWIDAVVGVVVIGATTSSVLPTFTKNAQGTGATEGNNAGDLGIEVTDAGTNVVEVTVIGRP